MATVKRWTFWKSFATTALSLQTESVAPATIVDLVENFYGASLEEVGKWCNQGDSPVLERTLRIHEFLSLHDDQFVGGLSPEQFEQSRRSATLPIYSRAGARYAHHGRPGAPETGTSKVLRDGTRVTALDPYSAMSSLFTAPGLNDGKELKSILLYSDGAILLDPFVVRRKLSSYEWLAFEDQFREQLNPLGYGAFHSDNKSKATVELVDRPRDFADTLLLLAAIAPLIRSGFVTVVSVPSRDAIYWGEEAQMRFEIGREFFVRSDASPIRFRESELMAWILLERAKDQFLAMVTLGEVGTTFAAGDLDLFALDVVMGEQVRLGTIDAKAPQRSSEDARLTELARLQLPGVDTIRPQEMVAVRDEDVFVQFRSDIRRALATSTLETRIDAAATAFSEEMRAALGKLGSVKNRDILARTTGGDAVSWAVGTLAGWSIAGWHGALAGLAAKGAYELARGSSSGSRVLHKHYVALS